MTNFKIKYIVQTSSRCGKYNYNLTDTVKADSPEEAVKVIKVEAGNKISFKRFKVIVKSIEEVEQNVEIHK